MIKCEECGAEYYDKQTICLICGTPLLLDDSSELDYPNENIQATKIILSPDTHHSILGILTKKEYQIDIYQNSKYNNNAIWMIFLSLLFSSGLTMANINLISQVNDPTAVQVGDPIYNFFSGFLVGMILIFILLAVAFFAFLAILMVINSVISPYSSFWGLFRLLSHLYFLLMLSIAAIQLGFLIFTGTLLGPFSFMLSDLGRVFVNFIVGSLLIMILGPVPYKNVFEKSYLFSLVVFILSTMVTGTIFIGSFYFFHL